MMPSNQRKRVIQSGVLRSRRKLRVAIRAVQLHVPVVKLRNHSRICVRVRARTQPEGDRQLISHFQARALRDRAKTVGSAKPSGYTVVAGPPGWIVESRG